MAGIRELRQAFSADDSNDIAKQVGDAFVRRPTPSRGWTTRAVWYERGDELLAVVGEQDRPRRRDSELPRRCARTRRVPC